MRGFLGVAVAFSALIVLAPWAHGLNFNDTLASDFALGSFIRTTTTGDNVTLCLANPGTDPQCAGSGPYYAAGNFTSRVFDAGVVVNWTNITWINVSASSTVIKLRTIAGNGTPGNVAWEEMSGNYTQPARNITGNISRFIRYDAVLETANTLLTPFLEEVVIQYEYIRPVVNLSKPLNNAVLLTSQVTFNCTASSPNVISNITLFTNLNGTWGPNVTLQRGNDENATFAFSNVPDGTYTWNCLAIDKAAQSAFAPANYAVQIAGADPPPVINWAIVYPDNIPNNSYVNLSMNATDNSGVNSVWATITRPDNSKVNVTLVNNGTVGYTAAQLGSHGVIFYASDTLGQVSSVQRSFLVSPVISFNITVAGVNQTGLSSNVSLLKGALSVNSSSAASGMIIVVALDDTYDLLVKAFGGDLEVLLRGVHISSEQNKALRLDKVVQGQPIMLYAVQNPYGIANGKVRLRYDQSLFLNESYIAVSECDDWNFSARQCGSQFIPISGFVQNNQANTIEFNVTHFSAFSLNNAGFCGDSVCSAGETNATCSQDCECSTGGSQTCGTTDVGECSYGVQSCINGRWGQCAGNIGPVTEICNRKDDNCDGTVDNVGGLTSAQTTKCQCFNAGSPVNETCNNIDDNCDGVIDEFTQPCGSNIGVCAEGIRTCTAGVYGNCTNGVEPQQEICSNNLDDDCDNTVNDGCPNCSNNIRDGDEVGIDCGGSCPNACAQFPYLILIVVGIVVLVILLVLVKMRKRTKWEDVERKYSYRPASFFQYWIPIF